MVDSDKTTSDKFSTSAKSSLSSSTVKSGSSKSSKSSKTGHSHSSDQHYGHGTSESSHSDTLLSDNTSGYTGGSNSEGTSQNTTNPFSTLSTVSISLKEYHDRYANDKDNQ